MKLYHIATILLLALFYTNSNTQTLPVSELTAPGNTSINNAPNALIDWTPSTGQTGYEYRYGLTTNLSSETIYPAPTSQVNLSDLLFGTTYYWQVRAVKTSLPMDSSNWSQVWSFTTIDQLTLVSPTNGATNQTPDALLDWAPLTGITNYHYQLDTTASFNSPLMAYFSISNSLSQANAADLRFGTTYYWRVRAKHGVDTSQWSQVWSFTTIDQLTLVSPTNGATNQTPDALLDWAPLTGITNYHYQLDTTVSFNSPLMAYFSISNSLSQANAADLRFGTTYYWRVRAKHGVDTSQWSQVWSFTTIDQLTLVSPTNGATNQTPDALLDWAPLTGITNYHYQLDTTASFNSPLMAYFSISNSLSQANAADLRFGTTYYWRVRAKHGVDTSQWSQVRSFTTIDQLTLVSPTNDVANVSNNPIIDWSFLSGITNYQYQLDTLSDFSTSFEQIINNSNSQANIFALISGKIYYWRVRAWHTTDTTNWSSTWAFGVGTVSNITPTFTQAGPFCNGASISALPTISNNDISGSWSPPIDNTTTTLYTFTPNAGQFAASTTMTITINPNATPSFTQAGPFCNGASISALPTTSNNSILGSWSPPIDNTATTLYTFTPNSGQCATSTMMTITINPNATPSFTQAGPFCNGASISALPTTSNNSILGSWSPPIDNTATTLYTFTPNSGQCATSTMMTITINPNATPSFTQAGPFCNGASISALPTTSNNSILGSWSPPIDNTATTLYTFTPSLGQCATSTTMTVIISTNIDVQPVNQDVNVNDNTIFIVNSSTPNVTYQWQTAVNLDFQNISDIGQYSGATTDMLTISNITLNNNNQLYRCIVSSDSCSDTSDVVALTVQNTNSINEFTQSNLFSIYPNPTENQINIKVTEKLLGSFYNLYDNVGKLILSGKINSENSIIELGNLPVGIYLFSVGGSLNQKFNVIKE